MSTAELQEACRRVGWSAERLAEECCLGEVVARDMLSGKREVWDDVAEHLTKPVASELA